MGLRDVLFGKNKLAGPARERLFALTTAAITLDTELGLRSDGAAAIVFKPLSAAEFVRAETDLQQLLDSVASSSGSKLERREDSFGYTWIVIRDPDLGVASLVEVVVFVGVILVGLVHARRRGLLRWTP